jgi:hypothetical protein
MPEADMQSMLRLIEEKICSSEIEVRHRDALVRLRTRLESDLSELKRAADCLRGNQISGTQAA